ncbi:MAG: transposase family protein [Cytophagales bacterium]|nr:MAG: transposase family protein [Cytophagales bacterium]
MEIIKISLEKNEGFCYVFNALKDPRMMNRSNFLHSFQEIMFLAVTASICGITDGDEKEMFGNEQISWFRKYYLYKNDILLYYTISRLFAKLCSKEFC